MIENNQTQTNNLGINRMTYLKYLFTYFLLFFLPSLAITYLLVRLVISFFYNQVLFNQVLFSDSIFFIYIVFFSIFLIALLAVYLSNRFGAKIARDFLVPAEQQTKFFWMVKFLNLGVVALFTLTPPTLFWGSQSITNLSNKLSSQEAAQYFGDVKLSNFKAYFSPNYQPGAEYRRLIIESTVESKKDGDYTFKVSFASPAISYSTYTLLVNGEQAIVADFDSKALIKTVNLQKGQSRLMFEFDFQNIVFNSLPIYKQFNCTFNYQIFRHDRKKTAGVLNQLGIKPEYTEWDYQVNRFDGENWVLPSLSEQDFYQ